ncbi:general substrate transporter [Xylariaceae sp. FL0804]|nr:general substrate transporter [Xylariaceae sp. FL0804]
MAPTGLRQCIRDVSPYLVLVIAISTLAPLQFGYHLAELNAPQDVISCRAKASASSRIFSALAASLRRTPLASNNSASTSSSSVAAAALPDCIPMDNAQFAVVSSMFTLGGLLGALGSGPVSSKYGRLLAMRLTSLCFLAGSVVETFGASIAMLAIGRVLSGVGAGAATVIVPIYISEVAPPSQRGTFGAMTQVSINVGILVTQTLGYFLSYGSAWRWVLGAGVIIAAGQGVGLLLVPESPAWLAAHQSVPRAKATLQRIRGRHYDIAAETEAWDGGAASPEEEALLDDPPAADESSSRRGPPHAKSSGGSSSHLGFVQVVRDPFYRPALVAAVGVMCAQQLCGINSIIMYSVSLLRDLLPMNSALLTILISAINLVTTVACSPLPDRLGRKTCLLLSIAGQGVSALALALSILFGAKALSAAAVLCFVAAFAVGLGPVPFMLASEMVGQEAVGATQSACLGANYVATFCVAQFFPIVNVALNERLGGRGGWVYFLFAALAALCGLFVWWRVPETKGRRDADEVWGRAPRRRD